ncbi:MAG: nickel pincer cofactor biosynthesis protein LarC [Desulforhopalus sp.]
MISPPSSARIGYLDCFSGVSGDMLLGAFLHAGLEQQLLTDELAKLQLDGLEFLVEEKSINAISGIKVTISSDRRQELRTLPAVLQILENSTLDEKIIKQSADVFRALARAEAKVHAIPVDKVHFHEVGALDTIIDVVGTVTALHHFDITRLFCSFLPTGHGFVKCAHGLLPLPAPAVCELLQGIPTYGVELQQELITPTGAALVATLAEDFGPLPPMAISATGYGAGTRTLTNGQPNLLRIIIGSAVDCNEEQNVEVIETNLDDWIPEGFPYLCERLFGQGALDVTLAPIQMKKGRPGFTLQVISPPACAHLLKDIILSETTAIGLRFRKEARRTLRREHVQVMTKWGMVMAKMVHTPTGTNIYPEYEECRKIASRHAVPLQEVYSEIRDNRTKPQ